MGPRNTKIKDYPTAIASGVTVNELKVHLGLFEDDSQDSYLNELILTAEQLASSYIGYAVGETTKVSYWRAFATLLTVPDKYLIDGETFTVQYTNTDDTTSTVDASVYKLDNSGSYPVVRLKVGQEYPTDLSENVSNPVFINYTAGFNPEQQSAALEHAVLMYCQEQWDNRGNTTDKPVNRLPLSAERLLVGYRRVVL